MSVSWRPSSTRRAADSLSTVSSRTSSARALDAPPPRIASATLLTAMSTRLRAARSRRHRRVRASARPLVGSDIRSRFKTRTKQAPARLRRSLFKCLVGYGSRVSGVAIAPSAPATIAQSLAPCGADVTLSCPETSDSRGRLGLGLPQSAHIPSAERPASIFSFVDQLPLEGCLTSNATLHRPSRRKHCLKYLENTTQRRAAQPAEPFGEALHIRGPNLIHDHKSPGAIELAWHTKWIEMLALCHRGNDDGADMRIQIVWCHRPV